MAKDDKKLELAPGEFRFGQACPNGHLPFARGTETGVKFGVADLNRAVVIRTSSSRERSSSGPCRVNSDAYRSGWDAIFERPPGKRKPEKAN